MKLLIAAAILAACATVHAQGQGLQAPVYPSPTPNATAPESAPTLPWTEFTAGKAVYCSADGGCVAMSADTWRRMLQEAVRRGAASCQRGT